MQANRYATIRTSEKACLILTRDGKCSAAKLVNSLEIIHWKLVQYDEEPEIKTKTERRRETRS